MTFDAARMIASFVLQPSRRTGRRVVRPAERVRPRRRPMPSPIISVTAVVLPLWRRTGGPNVPFVRCNPGELARNLRPLIHSALVLRRDRGAGASLSLVFRMKTGVEVGLLKRTGSFSIKLPTFRFRAKIILGFAV